MTSGKVIVERIGAAIQKTSNHNLLLLYGEGLDDLFCTTDNSLVLFEEALKSELFQSGVDRVAFIAPHRPLDLHETSSGKVDYSDDRLKNPFRTRSSSEMAFLDTGPLGRLMLFSARDFWRNGVTFPEGIGDLHGIRYLDHLMKDDTRCTAVVVLQAETTLRYFDDPRTLAGILGEWSALPAGNPNRCYLAFSTSRFDELEESVRGLAIPELRRCLEQGSVVNGSPLVKVGPPTANEIQHLLQQYANSKKISLGGTSLNELGRRMEPENRSLRYWKHLLDETHLNQELSLEFMRQAGWFSATRDFTLSLEQRLDQFVGLEKVKKRFLELAAWHQVQRIRNSERGTSKPLLHMIFSGNPGTGKTTLARLVGEVYQDLGLLKRGHLVDVRAPDLVADHVGGTALKTNRVVDRALNGVLFIDEAYTLGDQDRGHFGQEAMDTLLARLEDDRDKLVVIMAGYPQPMANLLNTNAGLSRRFPEENRFDFEDYSGEELWQIFQQMINDGKLSLTMGLEVQIRTIFQRMILTKNQHFGNAGEVRNLVDAMERLWAFRIHSQSLPPDSALIEEDIPEKYHRYLMKDPYSFDHLWSEFDALVGLQPVKDHLRLLLQSQRMGILRQSGQKRVATNTPLKPLIFSGNPGTGKTTVARLLGRIYNSLGLLASGHVVEVSRADLVAGHVGQTASKVMKVVEKALDGVLFIDEAYTLVNHNGQDFGREALDSLVKALDLYQDRVLLVAAGYPEEMQAFLQANPGLRSRFHPPISFPDLSEDELNVILENAAESEGYVLPPDVVTEVNTLLLQWRYEYPRHFGNARAVLSLYDHMKARLADRVLSNMSEQEDVLADGTYFRFCVQDLEGYPFSQPSHHPLFHGINMPSKPQNAPGTLHVSPTGHHQTES